MKALLTLAILAFTVSVALADPIVVDFDEFSGLTPLPAGYGGVASWNNWASTTGNSDYIPLSDPNVAINVGVASAIEFGQEVILHGFSFTGPNPGIFPVHLKLMLVGQVVFEIEEFHTNGTAFIWESPYEGVIDAMILDQIPGTPYGFFCIDDLTYDLNTVATESTTLSQVKALFR